MTKVECRSNDEAPSPNERARPPVSCFVIRHSFDIRHSTFGILLRLARWAWLSALGILSAAGCAGYQVGNASLYPSHIRTVYVPVFESDSFRPHLGERLTEAVIKEIEEKTPYKVVGDAVQADSVLSGRITGESKRVIVENRYDLPRQVEVSLQVQVRWLDRQENLIRQSDPIPLPPELATISETATATPETGSSIATAQQQAIHRLAEQIVGMMEAPW
jgi:hypothetical protein